MPSLQPYSTFGLQTACQSVVSFSSADEFIDAYRKHPINYIVGGGSNSIFLEDFNGTLLVNNIKGVSHFDDDKHHYISAGAGENWHDLVTMCMQNGWYGFENLALIPGSVGAAPIQNIGAYGREINAFIESVVAVIIDTGEQARLTVDDCQFGYRDSIFKHDLAGKALITQVNFVLPKHYSLATSYGELAALTNPSALDVYNKVIEIRQSKLPDPAKLGNAGSFFKNPVITKVYFDTLISQFNDMPGYVVSPTLMKVPAAWLIDQTGFKGQSINGVRCHPTQPLVLTNLGNASGDDVRAMASNIITAVSSTFGISLEPEVRLVGSQGLVSL
ncbi:UDP-N-acetylmuramate dehydrogenase [Alteromonas sp. A079]|uniref:UDP-N-acetylmuramate dehydrogenase n=1 Tax=Alteromonas sp. A079 TaxID=3410268 RepID=UPI003BA2F1F6